MSRRSVPLPRVSRVLLALAVACLAVVVPTGQQPVPPSALTPADPYPNFDIRDFKEDARLSGNAAIVAYMDALAAPPPAAADALVSTGAELASLRAALPGIDVQTNLLGGAEVVSAMPGTPMLAPADGDRVSTLRAFLRDHAPAYGLTAVQADELVVVADQMNPAGNMAWVELEQRFNGIPVFQGYLRGAFTAKGDLARTNGRLATGITSGLQTTPALGAADAVAIAAASVALPAGTLVEREQRDGRIIFERGALGDEPRAWLVYFPLVNGVARLAWVTEVAGEPLAFMIVVDAETGTILFRKNLTSFQSQAATYNIYPSDSPAPMTPSTSTPAAPAQAPFVARTNVTLVGNEAPNTFNSLGWITDGNNTTDGNNVQAGVDRDTTNGVDAPVTGSPSRVFTANYQPGTDDPLSAQHQRGSVIDMFYWVNRYHDETYRLGFTEQFRNFQHDNFGRGGSGNDRISAEGQDNTAGGSCSPPCYNNANFNTPADGGRGRMQMYLWNGPTPDYDGTIDHEIVIHELTHGLSNRLHANASGLSGTMSGGMGEGWSDFYARAMLADASEPVNGLYAMGGWATHLAAAGYTTNYYYGIRRFPYTVISNLGPNGKPHNPLTFADIDPAEMNVNDGAYPRGPFGSASAFVVHNVGEVWASILYEVRARLIARHGFAVGNQRALQYVTDGMKGDPVSPTFLQARDSILAAAVTSGASAAEIADMWAGFAARGLGAGATIENAANGSVTESFLTPSQVPSLSINDVALTEGNAGTKVFAFTVSLSQSPASTVTVGYATANGSATATAPAIVGTSGGSMALPGTGTSGAASPYPATITVAGVPGTITKLAVRLNNLTHTWPDDLDMLLVGPGGQKALFMSDIGGSGDASGLTITFEDGAAPPPASQLVAGTYAPTDEEPGDGLNAPAPAGPYSSSLSAFTGTNPNGTWSLYVMDDTASDTGSLGSFSLLMTTTSSTGADYLPTSGTLTFPPGTTTQTVNVLVNGDSTPELAETFFVNLTNATNAQVTDAQGLGTIINDDSAVPTAANDAYTATFNTPLTVPAPGVLANDNANALGSLTAGYVTPPAHGTVSLSSNGGFTYTPANGYAGPDSFTYRATAGGQVSAAATVSINVATQTVQPPTGFYVASAVGNRVVFRWTPPAAGPAATGYIFEGGVAPGQALVSLPLGPVPILTLDVPNGAFFARVKTTAGGNASVASNELPFYVNMPMPPSPPANLTGLVNGSALTLTWRNTFGGGTPAATLLDVTGTINGTLPLGPGESFSFPAVPPGTYTFRVRSANGIGESLASNAVSLAFPSGCSGAPQPPTRFLAYKVGATLHLIWESPASGPAATGYVVHATGSVTGNVPMGAATSLSVPVPPGVYNLSVSAVNACNSSTPTAVQTITVP